jgi:hypothetical protein
MTLKPPKVEDIKYFFELPTDENEVIRQNILHYLSNFDKDQLKIFLNDENYGSSWKKIKDEIDNVIINKLKNIEHEHRDNKQFQTYSFQVVKKVKKIIKEEYIIELYSNSKEKKSFYIENINLKTKREENDEYEKLLKEIEELCK